MKEICRYWPALYDRPFGGLYCKATFSIFSGEGGGASFSCCLFLAKLVHPPGQQLYRLKGGRENAFHVYHYV